MRNINVNNTTFQDTKDRDLTNFIAVALHKLSPVSHCDDVNASYPTSRFNVRMSKLIDNLAPPKRRRSVLLLCSLKV